MSGNDGVTREMLEYIYLMHHTHTLYIKYVFVDNMYKYTNMMYIHVYTQFNVPLNTVCVCLHKPRIVVAIHHYHEKDRLVIEN